MVSARKNFKTGLTMKEITSMEAKKAMVIMFVSREYIRDNSKEVRSTDKERSLIQMAEYTKGSGQMGS